jgi:ribosome-associated protein
MQYEDDDAEDTGPSKSERKRQSHDLQALGEALIDLPQEELDALPLPDTLREAVMLARRITKHGGLYRQKQYIGKLMRKFDAEPIREAIEARQNAARTQARQFHQTERWRSRLIDEGNAALDEFVQAYADADRAHLARLAAQARDERDAGRPPKASRELFGVVEKVLKRPA